MTVDTRTWRILALLAVGIVAVVLVAQLTSPSDERDVSMTGAEADQPRAPPTRSDDSPGERVVDAFRASASIQFEECADAQCLAAAVVACRPTHRFEAHHTIEGRPAFFDHFVFATPAGCRVVVFSDYSQDYWGGCKVIRRDCESARVARGEELALEGCGTNEIVYAAPSCPYPYGFP